MNIIQAWKNAKVGDLISTSKYCGFFKTENIYDDISEFTHVGLLSENWEIERKEAEKKMQVNMGFVKSVIENKAVNFDHIPSTAEVTISWKEYE